MADSPRLAVMGCKRAMPDAFPLDLRENAGNMIHANAPFEMFGDVVFFQDPQFTDGRVSFPRYVRENCTHLVVTAANTLKVGNPDPTAYIGLLRFLRSYEDFPVVIFGLGAQSPDGSFPSDGFPPEAIELMKYLGDHTAAIGVRGEYTAAVFEHYAGVTNTFVTGCPSFFSRPYAFDQLAQSLADNRQGRASYSGTHYRDEHERHMLVRAIREDNHLVESSNRVLTRYARDLQRGIKRPRVPIHLQPAVESGELSRAWVEEYFASRFHLFRETRAWYKFNQDCVSVAYGTRFHACMAALLSGVPALWVTHDSRTEELTRYLRLPAVTKQEAAALDAAGLRASVDYSEMYRALPELFDRFNHYLAIHRLPPVQLPDTVSHQPSATTLQPVAERRADPGRGGAPGRLMRRGARALRGLARAARGRG
ncbi:MAG: polysaccharide pyruvyl transferase family protein [Propionibacteriaceae bacterium]|nr:polysaccharide pyruvyl transferase family protein [Propionibacteriaceae bacterium]